MSAHYLIDLFGSPFSSAPVIDVRSPPNGQTSVAGALVVRVPDSVQVIRPTGLADLLTKKYQGILASHAGFARMVYDDLLDATGLDLTAAGTSGLFGNRGSIFLLPGGKMTTTATTLTAPAFSQALLTWDSYTLTQTDDRSTVADQVYTEVPSSPSAITCEVSVNAGTTFHQVYDGVPFPIPLADQGLSLVVRFHNVGATRLGIGSWAFVY